MIFFLDSAPVGLLTNPNESPEATECKSWLVNMSLAGHKIVLSDLIDYEVRRELIGARKKKGLARLNALKKKLICLPIDSEVLVSAAEL